jgi:hypothetical protein
MRGWYLMPKTKKQLFNEELDYWKGKAHDKYGRKIGSW